ncbi:hypothetical protein L2E82_45730 [Cichorium intybus]|uniref:Uncharacterized protein n=1 Tax=Cichorium intybus TaxID=13427 RepID=A0ACB8ZUC2_CICIN|nr:hypothetical protein L2E82_45730 [Cichorium intybus]
MPRGKSRAHVPLYWHTLCESLLVCRYSGIASETTMLIWFRLVMRFGRTLHDPGLSMYKWDNPSFTFQTRMNCETFSQFMLSLGFCGSCTSFEVLELFKVSIQSLILISEAIFVISNDKYRELHIQSEYAPMQQHPTSYRVHAYRANVRNTSCIKELRISLKHRGTGPDDLDHFLMCPITGLNPEAAESMELCFLMNDSYRVNIECISTIVLSGFPSCTSG